MREQFLTPESEEKNIKQLAKKLHLLIENAASKLSVEDKSEIERHLREALDIATQSKAEASL